MKNIRTPLELENLLGENIKRLRLQKAIPQQTLSDQAGISVSALKNLENGDGTSVKTLIRVIRALDREDWIETIAPIASINPLHMVQNKFARQRAPRRAHDKKEKK
jgi:transcriptional regulator with XRE-family HTH domain